MMAEELEPSTVRNMLLPLRAIYRQALTLDEVAVNPTAGVQLPAVRGRHERIAAPAEAARLIAALPAGDRAVWATALYAGLRSGELQALPDELVDVEGNVIRVEWSWDPKDERSAQEPRRATHRSRAHRTAQVPARAPASPRTARRPVLRPARRPAVLKPVAQSAGDASVGAGGS